MSEERDFGSVQNFYVKAPQVFGVPVETLIEDADMIYCVFPEDELLKYASTEFKSKVSSNRYVHSILFLF